MSNTEKKIDGGFFLSLEGPEGAGKSTHAKSLAATLRKRGYKVYETREPGGTVLGEELRHLVKHICGADAPCPEAELLLMAASRAQLVQKKILPFLEGGGIVVCDRFADSTTVYQGFARNLDMTFIQKLHILTTKGRWPDLTMILDIDVEESFKRSSRRAAGNSESIPDRFEDEGHSFHHAVRNGFLKLAEAEPERIIVIPANDSESAVNQRIMDVVNRVIK